MPDNTGENKYFMKFQKGKSGNPNGRPKGSFSIKDKIRQYLDKNPEEVQEMVHYFVKDNRELLWQMLEGSPSRNVDVNANFKVSKLEEVRQATQKLLNEQD